jgi:hypothetical protein
MWVLSALLALCSFGISNGVARATHARTVIIVVKSIQTSIRFDRSPAERDC